MLAVTILLEDYVTRGQVGSGFGRAIGPGVGALLGGLGLGAIGYGLSDGNFGNPDTMLSIAAPAIAGSLIGGLTGNPIGAKIGSKMISNPDKPADFGNKWHRWGYVNDEGPRIEWGDFLTSYNAKQRQAQALKRMGYDDIAIHSAINPGIDRNGIPNETPGSVALTDPIKRVVNK